MNPFNILADYHVSLKFLMIKYLSKLIIDIFNNKHIMTFKYIIH